MPDVLLVHGPNLNLLGKREPGIYGVETLDDINQRLGRRAQDAGIHLEWVQGNSEGTLIDALHAAAASGVRFVIINPAAYTHTSVALRDALLGIDVPFIEVHLSNVHAREPFRHHSYFSDVAQAVICGLKSFGYDCALEAAIKHLNQPQAPTDP